MDKALYYAVTLAESALGVVGIRAPYEQPAYAVTAELGEGVEVRAYEARTAVETDVTAGDEGAAFGRLFRYITGANRGGARIAMTAPVESGPREGERIAMTVPVAQGGGTMRFFLPAAVAARGAPEPAEPGVRIVRVAPETLAVLRFSGRADARTRRARERALLARVAGAGRSAEGAPTFMGYDPPFAIPFLRRNEVAVRLAPAA